MKGNFGVRERSEFLKFVSSSWVSDRLHLELPEEYANPRVRGGDGGVRTFLPVVEEHYDLRCIPICLSSASGHGLSLLFHEQPLRRA